MALHEPVQEIGQWQIWADEVWEGAKPKAPLKFEGYGFLFIEIDYRRGFWGMVN
jgi:hypothetical protein